MAPVLGAREGMDCCLQEPRTWLPLHALGFGGVTDGATPNEVADCEAEFGEGLEVLRAVVDFNEEKTVEKVITVLWAATGCEVGYELVRAVVGGVDGEGKVDKLGMGHASALLGRVGKDQSQEKVYIKLYDPAAGIQ